MILLRAAMIGEIKLISKIQNSEIQCLIMSGIRNSLLMINDTILKIDGLQLTAESNIRFDSQTNIIQRDRSFYLTVLAPWNVGLIIFRN